jgi:hypothetical protein
MPNRITIKTLKAIAERINTMTNSPLESYTKGADGKYQASIGNFHISQAYGGYSLHRMVNEGGGITEIFYGGHMSARELADRMYAFILGLEFTN